MFSIAIPTWEFHGKGKYFLYDLLESIRDQTLPPSEIIISDHSVNNDIYDMCQNNYFNLPIKYFRFDKYRGSPSHNLNHAIYQCSKELIKIMFQDDFFDNKKALETFYHAFGIDTSWVLCGSNLTNHNRSIFYKKMIPMFDRRILLGVNNISSPSVLAFKKTKFRGIKFDASLPMMMDCDFYYHSFLTHGKPKIITQTLVTNRIHENQLSNNYNGDIKEEIVYTLKKYHSIPCVKLFVLILMPIIKTGIKIRSLFLNIINYRFN